MQGGRYFCKTHYPLPDEAAALNAVLYFESWRGQVAPDTFELQANSKTLASKIGICRLNRMEVVLTGAVADYWQRRGYDLTVNTVDSDLQVRVSPKSSETPKQTAPKEPMPDDLGYLQELPDGGELLRDRYYQPLLRRLSDGKVVAAAGTKYLPRAVKTTKLFDKHPSKDKKLSLQRPQILRNWRGLKPGSTPGSRPAGSPSLRPRETVRLYEVRVWANIDNFPREVYAAFVYYNAPTGNSQKMWEMDDLGLFLTEGEFAEWCKENPDAPIYTKEGCAGWAKSRDRDVPGPAHRRYKEWLDYKREGGITVD